MRGVADLVELVRRQRIVCVGASHKTAPINIREQLHVSADTLARRLPLLVSEQPFTEALVLSTCNRLELYGVIENEESAHQSLDAGLISLVEGEGFDPSRDELDRYCYRFYDHAAIEHLLSVASSLDSLIVGETQIAGQFKDAVAMAARLGTLGPILDRLSQEALGVGKKVRSQTAIGQKTVSISHAAIDLAKRVFGDLKDHSFLLVGAGEMAEVAARYAASHQPREMVVVNRTLTRAQQLVDQLGGGRAVGFGGLASAIAMADVVITSTASGGAVITREMLGPIMESRRDRPLFICDIAVPRDVEPTCGELDEVYLFEVDDLHQVVKDNLVERQRCGDEAREFIRSGVDNYLGWFERHETRPVLASFRAYLDDLMYRELVRTEQKMVAEGFSNEQQQAVDRMLNALAKKISADAARAIHSADGSSARHLARALDRMFCSARSLTTEEENKSCPDQPMGILRQVKS